MISINDTDKRIEVLHMIESAAFEMLIRGFNDNVEKLVTRMMDGKTSDHETLILKGVINETKRLDPRVLAHTMVSKIEGQMKKAGMGVVVLSKTKKQYN
jgi:hypothetical protein|tara:strand:- start:677 stop:973 length:297 start_codon:yes stop_codon:yes gene_type:complete